MERASKDYGDYDDDFDQAEMARLRAMDSNSDWASMLEEVRQRLHSIRANIHTVSHAQDKQLFSYTQDMKMSEKNKEKVTMWSLAHLAILMSISIVQV